MSQIEVNTQLSKPLIESSDSDVEINELPKDIKSTKPSIEQALQYCYSWMFNTKDPQTGKYKLLSFWKTKIMDAKRFGIPLYQHFKFIKYLYFLQFFLFAISIWYCMLYGSFEMIKWNFETVTFANLQEKDLFMLVLIEVSFYALYVVWVLTVRIKINRIRRNLSSKRKILNPGNFTVFVTKVPTHCQKQIIKEYFSVYGEIAEVHFILKNEQLIKKCIKFQKLRINKQKLLLYKNSIDSKKEEKLKKIKARIKKTDGKINKKLVQLKQLGSKKYPFSGKCFVTFRYLNSCKKCLKDLDYSNIRKFFSKISCNSYFRTRKFQNKYILKVKQAENYDDYIPKNITFSNSKRRMRSVLIALFVVPMIIFSSISTKLLKPLGNKYLISFSIVFFSELSKFLVTKFIKYKRHLTSTQYESNKLRFILISDSLGYYIPLLISYYGPHFFIQVSQIVFVKSIIVSLLTPFKNILQNKIHLGLKRYYGRNHTNNQLSLNKYYRPLKLQLSNLYLNVLRIICYNLIFFTIFPLITIPCSFSLIILLYNHKYSILRQYAKPFNYGNRINMIVISFFGEMLFYHAIFNSSIILGISFRESNNQGKSYILATLLVLFCTMAYYSLTSIKFISKFCCKNKILSKKQFMKKLSEKDDYFSIGKPKLYNFSNVSKLLNGEKINEIDPNNDSISLISNLQSPNQNQNKDSGSSSGSVSGFDNNDNDNDDDDDSDDNNFQIDHNDHNNLNNNTDDENFDNLVPLLSQNSSESPPFSLLDTDENNLTLLKNNIDEIIDEESFK
ncbi:hypothetical protein M0813_19124 [Anaeramoeba flamelloides]|uniref:RRM domain-containing protein n=1 Tax=Anaeramoeba flamelloides TaxID=1746091 RepID=A0ABQ8YPC3_9EUKA|nr:hypothetical protein M0813_19124 [Anaeramoeba flamelloides]